MDKWMSIIDFLTHTGKMCMPICQEFILLFHLRTLLVHPLQCLPSAASSSMTFSQYFLYLAELDALFHIHWDNWDNSTNINWPFRLHLVSVISLPPPTRSQHSVWMYALAMNVRLWRQGALVPFLNIQGLPCLSLTKISPRLHHTKSL
jgi:hypothetical protein